VRRSFPPESAREKMGAAFHIGLPHSSARRSTRLSGRKHASLSGCRRRGTERRRFLRRSMCEVWVRSFANLTMYPLLRPGSIVQIDENQTKPSQVKWKNEHDRPIYFIELRGEFICSWCEILEGTLLAVPYPSPKSEIRKFAHPREAEVVGRVMSVAAMPLAGPEP